MRKFVTAIWALIVAAVSALIMLIPFVAPIRPGIANLTAFLAENALYAAVPALLLGLSLWLFVAQFKRGPQMPSTVVLPSASGEIRISLAAVDTLVRQAASQIKGVRELKTSFYRLEDTLGVHIRTTIGSDVEIPGLIAELQQKVTEHVLSTAGISIEQVKVLVENVSGGPLSRPEIR